EDGIRDFHVTGVQDVCSSDLACTLRVTISPVYSLPDFLKVPMVAMVVLLDHCFRARTIAASMAIGRPETIDDASLATGAAAEDRSEERRVGKECRSRRTRCRS